MSLATLFDRITVAITMFLGMAIAAGTAFVGA